jgi:hypothetical protein
MQKRAFLLSLKNENRPGKKDRMRGGKVDGKIKKRIIRKGISIREGV